jgi:MEDS: MEthanogen/methylotroph, DcmR Sensory domain
MISQDHSVRLCNEDRFLTDDATTFITEGLRFKEKVIIVVTAQHREALLKTISPEEMGQDNLMFFNAEEQLWKIMVNDWPSELRLRNVVASMIGQANQKGRVRIYGEMVIVLWTKGYTRAAIRLEELWNKLAMEQPDSLLYTHPLSKFIGGKNRDSLPVVSQLHTHVNILSSAVSG